MLVGIVLIATLCAIVGATISGFSGAGIFSIMMTYIGTGTAIGTLLVFLLLLREMLSKDDGDQPTRKASFVAIPADEYAHR